MPVLPLVGSISVTPGLILPSRSAASIIDLAMRSLTLHNGFMFSSLARTVATHPSVTLRSCTSGVLPMHVVMSFLIPAGRLAVAMRCSLVEGEKVERERVERGGQQPVNATCAATTSQRLAAGREAEAAQSAKRSHAQRVRAAECTRCLTTDGACT